MNLIFSFLCKNIKIFIYSLFINIYFFCLSIYILKCHLVLLVHPTQEHPIYMDFQATSPMDKRVLKEMLPYFCEKFGNPHSRTHNYGWEAEKAIEVARKVYIVNFILYFF